MADVKNVKTPKIPAGYEREAELAEIYFASAGELGEQAEKIKDVQRKAARPFVPKLKRLAAKVSADLDALRSDIASHPERWERPRTRELGGVKVGYRSLPDTIKIDSEEAVPLIRKHLPGQAKVLVNTKVSLNMKAIKALDAAKLHKIGGEIVEGGSAIVVSIAKNPVDKFVEALLAELDESEPEDSGEE